MKKISLNELVKKAVEFNNKGNRWHTHFLMPKCVFNNRKKYVVTLENETNNLEFYSESPSKPTKEMEKIEKLFYLYIKKRGV